MGRRTFELRVRWGKWDAEAETAMIDKLDIRRQIVKAIDGSLVRGRA